MPAEGEELSADESAPKAGTDISGETYENSRFRRMSRERFNALALWGLSQELRNSAEGCSFWSADNERQLAMVFLDSEEGDFWVVVVMRDVFDRFMPVGVNGPFPTARFAEHTLQTNLGESAKLLEPKVGASAEKSAGTDLLTPIDGVSRVDRAFAYLRDGVNQSAARELIVELSRWLPDMDGNLARDFQTTGYSARVWEFYLRLAFHEMNFLIRSEHAAPDFQLSRDGQEIFVEATTAMREAHLSMAWPVFFFA
ncbi:MAG: hypothetical protein JHD10_06205 [Sphingomonadaceae bacterium]|nr:hypothetical protein [Sphingomonadaceae bacterium]